MKEEVYKHIDKEDKVADLVKLHFIKEEGNEKSFYSWLISSNELFWDGKNLSFHKPQAFWSKWAYNGTYGYSYLTYLIMDRR